MNLKQLNTDLRFRMYCFMLVALMFILAGNGWAAFMAFVAGLAMQGVSNGVEEIMFTEDLDAIAANKCKAKGDKE